MELNGRWFVDKKTKRTLLFKGVNLSGGTKLPVGITSHERNGYWVDDDRNVCFVGRPFPLNEADEHLSRLVDLGFNLLRFIVTWEAVEHEGPGVYDQDYLEYVVQVLKKCGQHGIHVYIDPHQDCWSRHCGGSGHPGWTLTLAGLNPLCFQETNAAMVHNLYPEPKDFPKMIWNTNYQKLAAATMFTLFFAGKMYAPKCIVNGIHVQDYLQDHYTRCFKKVAETIHQYGLENTVVIGYDSMNEPGEGYLPVKDITKLSGDDTDFKKGLMPTAFQGMLLGSGIPTNVENWEFKWNGPQKTGEVLVDPGNVTAWLNESELKTACETFKWERASSWPAGCIWANHGVWDKDTQKVLLPNYFATEPGTDKPTQYITHWIDHLLAYAQSIRSIHTDAIMFVQPPILQVPPQLPAVLDRLVYAPHWYDGLTLVNKKWNKYNVDFIGLNRGKYGTGSLRFIRALRIGEKAIRQCFADQLKTLQTEGLDNIGDYPCILGEIGIPYDMESSSKANTTSSFWSWFLSFFASTTQSVADIGQPGSSQNKAMDANLNALEKNLLNYSLWNYMPDNNAVWGDCWNGEDLSIWQASDSSAILNSSVSISTSSTLAATESVNSNNNKKKTFWTADEYLDNFSSTESFESASQQKLVRTKNNNVRNVVSLHRPHPRATAGIPLEIDFISPTQSIKASFRYSQTYHADCQGPTEIYVPTCHFPLPSNSSENTKITTSVGRWDIATKNTSYWILLWWIDQDDIQEATLQLEGITLSN